MKYLLSIFGIIFLFFLSGSVFASDKLTINVTLDSTLVQEGYTIGDSNVFDYGRRYCVQQIGGYISATVYAYKKWAKLVDLHLNFPLMKNNKYICTFSGSSSAITYHPYKPLGEISPASISWDIPISSGEDSCSNEEGGPFDYKVIPHSDTADVIIHHH